MQHSSRQELQKTLEQLKIAEAELSELNRQLSAFEAVVDAQLGALLDQLSELNAETASLDATLRHIREARLFGSDQMQYLEGAPQPARKSNMAEVSPLGLADRATIHAKDGARAGSAALPVPDIKTLYRKLARRHHPDLAQNSADRLAAHEQMAEINRLYQAGDIRALMRLAGMWLPYGLELPDDLSLLKGKTSISLSEQEQAEQKLKAVRAQISRLSDLPILKLSLDVKLARHQGRNLLREMAGELQYKVGRKVAERDYLKAQINIHGRIGDGN
jgi:muconolactone delta-isomerase